MTVSIVYTMMKKIICIIHFYHVPDFPCYTCSERSDQLLFYEEQLSQLHQEKEQLQQLVEAVGQVEEVGDHVDHDDDNINENYNDDDNRWVRMARCLQQLETFWGWCHIWWGR